MTIFGIGLSKTGTTSLSHALEILGYKTKDYPGIVRYRSGDLSSIDQQLLQEYDAFTDTPIPSFYRELDTQYPGSKFILTTREINGWLKSCKKQFNEKLADKQNDAHKQLFMDLYNCTIFDEKHFRAGYEKHTNEVLKYFQDRPDDLLIMDIAGGDDWDKLCPFLGASIPDIPFPKSNVTQIRWLNIHDIVDIAHHAGKEIQVACRFRPEDIAEQRGERKTLFETAGTILNNAMYSLRGGPQRLRKRVINKTHKLILKRLHFLGPRIPVISRERNTIPYSTRRKWNHCWLIDTFDDEEILLKPDAVFTISIALIEDGKPFLGVVYAPSIETTYYAVAGKGAFKTVHGEPARQLRTGKEERGESATPIHPPEVPASINKALELGATSKAFALCLAAEGITDADLPLKETTEWQTAGANAVLNCAGMKIISHNTNEELAYNKEQLYNGLVVIE